MNRELWEKVDTRTLRPGDVVVNYAGEKVVWDAGDSQIVSDNPAGPWHIPCLFRRIPDAEDPRVLRRALKDACNAIKPRGRYGVLPNPTPEDFIAEARRELQSEAGK